ncbi:MAG: hypothetical protein HYU80_02820 [Candidatus Blackburnbacteria bacterium]|nr:hypothetical protein [Candidatus Blackburnbacteria bacterium]
MKHYIFHGDNHVESRGALTSLITQMQGRGFEVVKLDGAVTTKPDLLTAAKSQMLISLGQLVVVENLLSLNKKGGEIFGEVGEELQKPYLVGSGTVFVFWEKKSISPASLKSLSQGFFVREFKVPVLVFKFLDSVYPKNTRYVLKMLEDVQRAVAPEFLLIMLSRQVRLLIWVKCDPDTLKVPGWQKTKLITQAEKFTVDQLFSLHNKLLELDRAQKHSQLPEDLPSSLALLALSV